MSTAIEARKRIANFEVIELIGSGGMASIYKATQLSLERPVALKVMHRHLTANENFVARFEKEAKRAATMHHENIVSIIDYGSVDGEYFIAMEYIEGQNLKQMMTRMKRLPLEAALLIGREIANGLKYAHNNGLIHRDIKPANIMLSTDGRILITDFGIAKDHTDLSITDTGQMIGSPAYMSPEQAAGRPIDHRCDIFSLGIVLYEIIIGERPFKGDTYQEMITNIISASVPDLAQLRVDVTSSLDSIVRKCLHKDIEGRYQDAELLAADLDNELKDFVIPAPRKLMTEFVKNPIRTTEKLRSDRIAKHTEKALYLMNLGHGRLADATREFENVLRFDRTNKTAKTYLDKLRSGQIVIESGAREPKLKKTRFAYLGLVVAAAAVVLSIFGLRGIFGKERSKADSAAVEAESKTAEQSGKGSVMEGGGQAAVKPPTSSTAAERPTPDRPQTAAKKSSDKEAVKKAAKSNISPTPAAIAADYPDQDISEYGLVTVNSTPPAIFAVDFKDYGKTNGAPAKLAPGRHLITIRLESYRTYEKRIFVEKGKSLKIEAELTPQR